MVSFGANVVKKADISDRITDKPSLVSKISPRKNIRICIGLLQKIVTLLLCRNGK